MEEPTAVVEEATKKNWCLGAAAACKKRCLGVVAAWKEYPSLWAALIVLVVGVVGTILINALPLPTQEWIGNNQELYMTLSVLFQALTYLGVIWLGGLLAYWAILKKKK